MNKQTRQYNEFPGHRKLTLQYQMACMVANIASFFIGILIVHILFGGETVIMDLEVTVCIVFLVIFLAALKVSQVLYKKGVALVEQDRQKK